MKTNAPESAKPAYDDEGDALALRGIANGDRTAFRKIHDRYDGLLFTTIQNVLNDREDSQEVLQEVFSTLWRKAHLFNGNRGRPVTWMVSLARNRAIDRIRSKQRKARLRDEFTVEQEVNPVGAAPITGIEAAERRDTCERVRSAVCELTPAQREAIELSYFDGLTQLEIAERLGEPLGTVKARIRRGIGKLRRIVKDN
ncbi:MAG: sigma-70 family RNA polymerase sigma factor [Verrucomicrobiales bacterium]|nr:sigma-70 family RNA polymerase sigma factor [Verrucomicrobiales bacterium]